VRDGEHELAIVFRDHALSDMVGFHYQRSTGKDAAEDFVRHLHNIRQAIPEDQTALVSVILDGENCWEHYPEGGVPFLRSLYQLCTTDKAIRPVKLGEYLESNPPRDTLPHLFAGSWINHNFAIWIGHEEDVAAWNLLHKTREHVKDLEARRQGDKETRRPGDKEMPTSIAPTISVSPGLPVPVSPGLSDSVAPGLPVAVAPWLPVSVPALDQAWEELYIAEGSDWFWWYGDDHSSAQDELFDYLFRKHLQNVYLRLGETPPPELSRPIKKRVQRRAHSLPLAFLDVKIDGRETFFEWTNAGRYRCVSERGAMGTNSPGSFSEIYFGFNRTQFFLRIDFDQPAKSALPFFDVLRIAFDEPRDCELRIVHPARSDQHAQWQVNGETAPAIVEIGIDRIAECAIPFDAIGADLNQSVQFYVELLENEQSRDRAPRGGAITFTRPPAEFESIMWDV
jgi:hypothetical protein